MEKSTKTVYLFDTVTREALREYEAHPDIEAKNQEEAALRKKLESDGKTEDEIKTALDNIVIKFIEPIDSTDEPFPTLLKNQAAIRNADNTAWDVVDDYRGETWYMSYNEPVVIEDLGEAPSPSWSKARPDMPIDLYKAEAIRANQKEAGDRIAGLFGTTYDDPKLSEKQINSIMGYLDLLEKERDKKITTKEAQEITKERDRKTLIQSIRQAENDAASLINSAADRLAVDEITVIWP